MSTHLLEKPGKSKLATLKFGTKSVTRYKTTAAETQRNIPKVTRLIGKSKTLMTGFARSDAPIKPRPAKSSVRMPFSNCMPPAMVVVK